jgi:ABC-type glycerol-3-phosphate transport system substrate-binding protein
MRAPACVAMLILASVIALAGCGSVSRSAAEYVSPALYRSVTVTATILTYSGPRIVTRRFTSAVVVTELADKLNAAPAVSTPLEVHCPEMGVGSVSYYELTF